MKKIFFLGARLVALASSPVLAQATGADVVLVRSYHVGTPKLYSTIVRGAAKPEEQQMKGSDAEEIQVCQQVIAKLYQEGYTLKSTFSTGRDGADNLLFVKE